MAYTKTNWSNDNAPAINEENLNKIEDGIFDAHTKNDEQDNKINEINSINEYSGQEKIVGKWTNGKNIYRKTISGTYRTTNSRDIVDLVENVETPIRGFGFYSPNENVPRNQIGSPMIGVAGNIDAYSEIRFSANNILQIAFITPQTSYQGLTGSYIITLEYTKL